MPTFGGIQRLLYRYGIPQETCRHRGKRARRVPGRMALVLWTIASVLVEHPTHTADSTPAPTKTRAGTAAWRHGSSISRSTLRNQRLRRVTNRKNRRRLASGRTDAKPGSQAYLNSRPGRPGVQPRGIPGPKPSSPSCGVDRSYRKPGVKPKEPWDVYSLGSVLLGALGFKPGVPDKSQGGEDAFLNRYFNGTRVGTYLDIGCNDGIDGSNTYYFQQRGWQARA